MMDVRTNTIPLRTDKDLLRAIRELEERIKAVNANLLELVAAVAALTPP